MKFIVTQLKVHITRGLQLLVQIMWKYFNKKDVSEKIYCTSPSSSSTSRKSKSLKTLNCCSLFESSIFSCSLAPSSEDTKLVWCSIKSKSPQEEKITYNSKDCLLQTVPYGCFFLKAVIGYSEGCISSTHLIPSLSIFRTLFIIYVGQVPSD